MRLARICMPYIVVGVSLEIVLASGLLLVAVIGTVAAYMRGKSLHEIQSASSTFEIVAQHANDGIVLQQADATILWCNDAYCQIMGRDPTFWVGKRPQKWVYPPDLCPSDEEIEAFRYDENSGELGLLRVQENMRADGSRFWNQTSVSAVPGVRDGERLYVLSCRDVTKQVEREAALALANEKLEKAVNYDALTGLANRRKLMAFFEEALLEANHRAHEVGVVHIDLDKFKEINDTHGHAAGDAVLIDAAQKLRRLKPIQGLTARLGGDEFIMLVPNLVRADVLTQIAQDFLNAVSDGCYWNGIRLNYSASLGLAVSAEKCRSSEELINRADFALYEAKSKGRNTFMIYDAPLARAHVEKKRLAADLAQALRHDELSFHFQPIVNLKEGRIEGFETLARWHHPQRGLVNPGQFIDVAHDIGLLEDLDMSAMRAAIAAKQHLRSCGFPDLYASFNASFQTLQNEALADTMTWAMDAADFPRHQLVAEVLETVIIDNPSQDMTVAQQIARLEAAGFRARLDDFGVGYAGLAHLAQLSVHGIKIDRSLIRQICSDVTSKRIVTAILSLANELKIDVVAEGVENLEIARQLVEANCASMQGYGIAYPMPLPDLIAWLHDFENNMWTDIAQPEAKQSAG